MAMLRTLCDQGYDGEIGFLNYARSAELALYGAELEQLIARHPNLRVARGFTRGRDSKLNGRFCRDHLRRVTGDHAAGASFVCGPPALIDGVRALWADDGLGEPAVEMFTPPLPSFDTAGAEGTVSYLASGREAANSGLPLLEQAEDAGLIPAHGCRMGICNTCSCLKSTGAVQNVFSGEISTATDELIRICVSIPLGDVALEL
jgi:stearoyl-CoA 9-desaturase NADPH oxidoreductase